MHIDLSGKRAIVTGSTAGIGLAIVKGLAACGASVVLNGRSQDSVEAALKGVSEELPQCDVTGFSGDLSTADGCAAMVKEYPECDILVNNLGIYGPQDFFDTNDEDWSRYIDINVMSGVRLARAYLPGMKQKSWGRVVFISSESGENIPPDMLAYGFCKAGVMAIARGLAKLMSGTGVNVNSVLPGPTLSKGVRQMIDENFRKEGQTLEQAAVDFVKENRPSSVLQRPTSVEEVANMVVYACSKEASGTTGAALRVDGGVVDCL